MSISLPSNARLPHASAGPLWYPPPAGPVHDWHEIETLLAGPASGESSAPGAGRVLRSFTIVAAAMIVGGGVLAAVLVGTRPDCGATCHVATADAAAKPASGVETAGLLPQTDTRVVEGRSAAEPALDVVAADAPDSAAAPVVPEPDAPALHHRHHHHHHHQWVQP